MQKPNKFKYQPIRVQQNSFHNQCTIKNLQLRTLTRIPDKSPKEILFTYTLKKINIGFCHKSIHYK